MAIKISSIRTLYFYVISLIGLLMIAFSTADLVNTALKTWVFPKAEEVYLRCPYDYPQPVAVEGVPARTPEELAADCERERERALEERVRGRQSSAVRDVSFLVVGIPLFWFHFRTAQRERREEKENS
ncbi:hypothetical protein HY478_00865 [Candidatus Uhrbacteria bacterium]|nr:hypothetical protein [Candidatus Uhrbacteria bacterium]